MAGPPQAMRVRADGWDRRLRRAAAATAGIRMSKALAAPVPMSPTGANPDRQSRDKPAEKRTGWDSRTADRPIAAVEAAGRTRRRHRPAAAPAGKPALAGKSLPAGRPAPGRAASEPRTADAADRRKSSRTAPTRGLPPARRRRSPAMRINFGPWADTVPASVQCRVRSTGGRVNTRNAAAKGRYPPPRIPSPRPAAFAALALRRKRYPAGTHP